MRKVLKSLVSLLVIATMLLSMASVSFASNAETPGEIVLSTDGIKEVTFEDETFQGVVVTASAVIEGEYFAGWDEGKVSYDNTLFEFVGMEKLEYVADNGVAYEWPLAAAADNASAGEVNVGVGIGNEVKADLTFPCDVDGSGVRMVNLYFAVKADVVADGQVATFTPHGSLVYFDYDQDMEDPKAIFGAIDPAYMTLTGTDVTFPEAAPTLYTITYTIDGETVGTQEYEEGATITALEAPAKEGFTFDGWANLPATMPAESITVTGSYTEVVVTETSGSCGTDATWALDLETGVLTISGTGAMSTYTTHTGKTPPPWLDLASNIKSVVISEGITSIGNYAFDNYNLDQYAITEISLPSTLTTIGAAAFRGNANLTEITMPSVVDTVGNQAFNYCSALATVTVSGSKEDFDAMSIGTNNNPFLLAMWTVTEPSGNIIHASMHGNARWAYNEETKKLEIYKNPTITNTTVKMNGFDGGYTKTPWKAYMNTVEEIEVSGISEIVGNAFRESTSLKRVIVNEGTSVIMSGAFGYNQAIETISLPSTLTAIGNKTFYLKEGHSLNRVYVANSLENYQNNVAIGTSNVEFNRAFTEFNDDSYKGWHSYATWWEFKDGVLTLVNKNSTNGSMKNYTDETLLPWYEFRDRITSIVVPKYTTYIGARAFMNVDNVTSVTLPATVNDIGGYSFAYMDSLEEITFTNAVTKIQAGAFYECSNLKTINFIGTAEEYAAITVGARNTQLSKCTVNYIQ